ncbi:leucine-rich repeat protein [Tanacetum coccineum]
MKELESFDLSLNKLSGELSLSLSSLNSLSTFNVSYNNLTGRIPSSTQLQRLNELCCFGNELCRDPLTVRCSRMEAPDTDHEEDVSRGTYWGLIIRLVSGFIVGLKNMNACSLCGSFDHNKSRCPKRRQNSIRRLQEKNEEYILTFDRDINIHEFFIVLLGTLDACGVKMSWEKAFSK